MVTKKFTYRGLGKAKQLIFKTIGIAGISIFTAFSIGFFIAAMRAPRVVGNLNVMDDPRVPPICFGAAFIILAWALGLAYINLLPTVWVDETGLTISTFFFFHKSIPWKDLVDITPIRYPLDYLIVRARKITLSHRFIGWIYSRTFYPSFLIAKDIENWDELHWIIRNNIVQLR